jgi:hypothetical protein
LIALRVTVTIGLGVLRFLPIVSVRHSLAAALLATVFSGPALHAAEAEWQWSVEMSEVTSPETGGPPRAFLWIPPDCERVRGIVVGQHNMEEEPILEHPVFRDALRELGFAAVWVTPPFDLVFDFEQGAGRLFESMMADLAKASGYSELAFAPIIPIGHSAAASFPWNFAAWAPQRTLAVISVSGQWPVPGDTSAPPPDIANLDGIPGLVTIGEYEWADERASIGLKQRAAFPRIPLTMLGEAGGGHFEVSHEKIAYLALYLRKAAQARLPSTASPNAPVALRRIDPTSTGWLVDRWRGAEPTRVPAAPVSDYAEPEEAFWCFDEEHAIATEKFRLNQRGKPVALLGYAQDGAVLPQIADTHQQVTIPFRPLDDGITFKLSATFIDTVPKGRPERWTGFPEGARVGRPVSDVPVAVERICGPVEKLSHDMFALRFYRMGLNNRKRTAEIWFAATHPGDRQFKCAVQQAVLHFPLRNEEGVAQRITFAPVPDQRAGSKTVRLNATSDAGERVHFYVREGPATISGNILTFTPIPPRAKLPLKVTVVAWHYGRSVEPKLKTAEPVERSFHLVQ